MTASRGRIHCLRRPASRDTLRFPHRQVADAGAERRAFPVEPLQPQVPRLAHRQSAPPRLERRGVTGSSPSWPRAPVGRTTVGRHRPDLGKPRSSPGSQREARHQTHPTSQTPAGSEGRRTRARPSKTPQRLVDSRSRKSPAPASRSPSTQSMSTPCREKSRPCREKSSSAAVGSGARRRDSRQDCPGLSGVRCDGRVDVISVYVGTVEISRVPAFSRVGHHRP